MNKPYVRHRWELTLALTLFFVLCYAAFCSAQQENLSEDVLRPTKLSNCGCAIGYLPLCSRCRSKRQTRMTCACCYRRICRKSPMRRKEKSMPAAVHNWSRRNWRAIGIRQKRMIRFRFRRDGMTDCSCASARRADTIGGVSYILRCASTRQKERQH